MGDETYIPVDSILLPADLIVPYRATGLVVFVHGSGSSRLSPRNRSVAEILRASGLGTLLFDLLTREEEAEDRITAEFRFDIGFLAERLLAATHWARRQVPDLSIGYFGASTGAAAALAAATQAQHSIGAIVSRGGRPDLAGRHLPQVRAPTLLIVGGLDGAVIDMNRAAYESLACEKDLRVIPGASHLFEEPGTLDQVARFAADWFQQHLGAVSGARGGLGSTRPSHPHPRH
jgi:putative phosphoribosyl transferase